MENIIEKLKKFREIRPDTEYSLRSKAAILAAPVLQSEQNPVFELSGNFAEFLKKLKQIQPDAEYSRISKLAILNAPILARRPVFNWQLAFTMTGLLLILVSGSLIHNLKPAAPHLNAQALENEFNDLDIDIQLAKIDYAQKADETVSLALKEITSKQTSHLNP
ncbi:MAG: hypothetical protein WC475_04650, partial [Candidatus Paceibacterota bacterium]